MFTESFSESTEGNETSCVDRQINAACELFASNEISVVFCVESLKPITDISVVVIDSEDFAVMILG